MNYGDLFTKAWNLVWNNKFLIVLGILVTLGGAGGSGGGSQGASATDGDFNFQLPPEFDFNFSAPWESVGIPALALIVVIIGLLLLLALWVVGVLSRGGLIYGADTVSKGQSSSFAASFRAGWAKGWRLIGIGLVPAIPGVLLMLSALAGLGLYAGNRVISVGGEFIRAANIGILIPIAIACILLPVALALSLLRTFANRACMLEDLGVFASYRRGFQVLGSNLGPALILFLLQIAISIAIGLVLLLPGIVVALCCLLWPLLLLVQGTFAAFYSTLWTLAWNQWTASSGENLAA